MSQPRESQEPAFSLLSDSATHGGAKVKRIDTHAASVFLAGERAFKVKRAVRFPFLDFSTLEQRRSACAAEIAVNRPFAPKSIGGSWRSRARPMARSRLMGAARRSNGRSRCDASTRA